MKILYFFSILVLFIACAGSGGPDPELLAQGKKVYDTYCVACHGSNGALAINGAKDLNLSVMTLEERIENITKGKNMMTAFENVLKKEEIIAVAEFTLAHFKKK